MGRIRVPVRRGAASAAAVLMSAVMVVANTTVAQAERARVSDRVGDTNAANDVTEIAIKNGPKRIRVGAHFRNLGPKHISSLVEIDTGAKGAWIYGLARRRDLDGDWEVRLFRFNREQKTSKRVACHHKSADSFPGPKSKIVFRLPQRCLGKHAGDARFRVLAAQHEGSGPPKQEYAPKRRVLVERG